MDWIVVWIGFCWISLPLAQGGVDCRRSIGIRGGSEPPSHRAAHTRDRWYSRTRLVLCGVGDAVVAEAC